MSKDLVKRLLQGDPDAWEEVRKMIVHLCVSYAYKKGQTRELGVAASEVAFEIVYTKLPTLREPKSFPAWCAQICTNAVNNEIRKLVREGNEIPPNTESPPGIPLTHIEALRQLEQCMRKLMEEKEILHQVIIFRYFDELGFREVGEQIERTYANTRKMAERARNALRKCMEDHGYPDMESCL
ncbi:MAG: sigma-70 family RNA polymerase sigma factor [Chloroflexota bacterium]